MSDAPDPPDGADRIVARIARALADPDGDPLDALSRRLDPTDLQSLMLHVYRQRSARRTPAELLAQFERSAMVQPSTADLRLLVEIERLALDCAAGFSALDLPPIAPLGLNAVLGSIDQNKCLATVRGAEVMADPTTLQALECARRRRGGERGDIRLCARSRQLRVQHFDGPGFSPHFALFSLVTAGRDRGGLAFELASLREHLTVYLTLLERRRSAGAHLTNVTVLVSDTARDEPRLQKAEAEVLAPLRARFAGVTLRIDREREQGRNYYRGLCLRIDASTAADAPLHNLADGGFTDWTARLLANAKERLLVSGLGIELLTKLFR